MTYTVLTITAASGGSILSKPWKATATPLLDLSVGRSNKTRISNLTLIAAVKKRGIEYCSSSPRQSRPLANWIQTEIKFLVFQVTKLRTCFLGNTILDWSTTRRINSKPEVIANCFADNISILTWSNSDSPGSQFGSNSLDLQLQFPTLTKFKIIRNLSTLRILSQRSQSRNHDILLETLWPVDDVNNQTFGKLVWFDGEMMNRNYAIIPTWNLKSYVTLRWLLYRVMQEINY